MNLLLRPVDQDGEPVELTGEDDDAWLALRDRQGAEVDLNGTAWFDRENGRIVWEMDEDTSLGLEVGRYEASVRVKHGGRITTLMDKCIVEVRDRV